MGGLALVTAIVSSVSVVIAQEPPSGEPLFVRASVDNDRPYLGQQVAYVFRIYRRSDFSAPAGETRYEPPGFAGFWNSEMTERREYSETVGAHQYSVVELRTPLFPIAVGRVEIGAARLLGPGGNLESAPVALDALPLPPGAPDGFTGAVGMFEIAAEVDETTVEVNEPARVAVRISGVGNIGALPEPAWPELRDWRLIESPSRVEMRIADSRLTGIRTYDLALGPERAGQLTIPAVEYAYFDPELERYVRTATSPIVISVLGADGSSAEDGVTGMRRDERGVSDLRPLMLPPSALGRVHAELTERVLYWAAWLVPTLLIAGALVWRRRQAALQISLIESRRRNALANARNILSRSTASGVDPAVAAAEAVLSYLSDRLGGSLTGLTNEGIIRAIRVAGVPEDVAVRVGRAIAEGEAARFTPGGEGTATADDHAERAIRLLTDLGEALES